MALSSLASFATFNPQIALKRVPHIGRSKKYPSQTWRASQDPSLLPSSSSTPSKLVNYETVQTRTTDDNHDMFAQYSQKLDLFRHLMSCVAQREPLKGLNMIDAVQRLGIDYHYQREINEILHKQMCMNPADGDLHEVALRFRLLRQHSHYVSHEVFSNFKDSKRMFKQVLRKDIEGLLSLYEASQLSIEGEDVRMHADVFNRFKSNEKRRTGLIAGDEDIMGLAGLCEASHLSFPGEEALDEVGKLGHLLLTAWSHNNLEHHQARLVAHTLDHPYHKSLTRFMAKRFLNNFQGQETWVSSLQEIAKLEFNMVESQIRNEILQVTKWWNELGLNKELKFVRDQPIKWYSWPMVGLVDPRLSQERIELTKAISLVYIIDDVFDVHGTLEELVLFTAAVTRWDGTTNDELPDYMKTCFKALDDITNDISESVYERHGWNPIETLRNSWARLCKAFLVEAQWFRQGQLPCTEDYLKNGIISSGVPAVLTHAFFILGQGITNETVDLFNNTNLPSVVSSTAIILRLWDDFGSAEDEEQDGCDGSYIDCYMNEHKGSSVEEAQAYVVRKISDEWKYLNQECFTCNPFPESFTQLALNGSRMVPMMYDYNSQHRLPTLEENMKALLFDSFLAKGIITHG